MYYDDAAKRLNFVSGLVLGAVLGSGLALALSPQKRVPRLAVPGRRGRRRPGAGRRALLGALAEALQQGRKHLGVG